MRRLTPEPELSADDNPRRLSANAHGNPYYTESIDRVARWHARSKEKYLDLQEQQELAGTIQAGRQEVEARPEIQEALRGANNAQERLVICMSALAAGSEAKLALDRLIESNLEYAAFLARASIGLVSTERVNKVTSKHKPGRSAYLGAFGDITNLRSPKAVLADREQIANLGLIEAAWEYKPNVMDEEGKPVPFLAFAKWRIHGGLYRHVVGSGEESFVSYSHGQHEGVEKDRKKTQDSLSKARRREINQFDELRAPYDVEAVKEVTVEDEDIFKELTDRLLVEKLLSKLSEQQRLVIILRYGLTGDDPTTLETAAEAAGLRSRQHTHQIESKAMNKLRRIARAGLKD